MRINHYQREACVTTLEQAVRAERNGADQLELCEHLEWDGITPRLELIETVLAAVNIPIKVLIRPRKGSFVYTPQEMQLINQQVRQCTQYPLAGIVTGMLTNEHQLNLQQLESVLKSAADLPVFIHKAIDTTPDPVHSVRELRKKLPAVAGILTSGGATTAGAGIPILKQLLAFESERFGVVVAGKVTATNITQLHRQLNARFYHGRLIVG